MTMCRFASGTTLLDSDGINIFIKMARKRRKASENEKETKNERISTTSKSDDDDDDGPNHSVASYRCLIPSAAFIIFT
jgi:hypothetical protein